MVIAMAAPDAAQRERNRKLCLDSLKAEQRDREAGVHFLGAVERRVDSLSEENRGFGSSTLEAGNGAVRIAVNKKQ